MPSSFQRLFADGGVSFAVSTAERLYVANLKKSPFALSYENDFGDQMPVTATALAFSPDQTRVLEHRDTKLYAFDLDPTQQLEAIATNLAPPGPCSNGFRAAPGSYCGSGEDPRAFAWSDDSSMVAYATSSGELWVLRYVNSYETTQVEAAAECSGGCSATNHFEFQPDY